MTREGFTNRGDLQFMKFWCTSLLMKGLDEQLLLQS